MRQKHLDLGNAPDWANTGDKVMTLVASVLAGGDCIDDADVLRTGGTACTLGGTVKVPSTLGTFLHSATDGGRARGRTVRFRFGPRWDIRPEVDALLTQTRGVPRLDPIDVAPFGFHVPVHVGCGSAAGVLNMHLELARPIHRPVAPQDLVAGDAVVIGVVPGQRHDVMFCRSGQARRLGRRFLRFRFGLRFRLCRHRRSCLAGQRFPIARVVGETHPHHDDQARVDRNQCVGGPRLTLDLKIRPRRR